MDSFRAHSKVSYKTGEIAGTGWNAGRGIEYQLLGARGAGERAGPGDFARLVGEALIELAREGIELTSRLFGHALEIINSMARMMSALTIGELPFWQSFRL